MNPSRVVDVTFEAIGTDVDGNEVRGTVTARANLAALPWPDQQWDGCSRGDNSLRPTVPVRILKLVSMAIVDEADCSKYVLGEDSQ